MTMEDGDKHAKVKQRKIIHIDMDCFYAAVEMRDDESLKGIPIAVGGSKDRRGVISTCNYEARSFGIHSAMATAYALKLCPALKVIPGRMSHYKSISKQLRSIFERYTDLIEPLSLDEAFLDVSGSMLFNGSATLIAKDIRKTIEKELKLTASAGVAPNKFLAKIGSDENKPDGQFVIKPEDVDEFVRALPLSKIPGVGKVTAKRLAKHKLLTCEDVRAFGKQSLIRNFSSLGETLWKRSFGIDERKLTTHWVRKSMSVEHTFAADIIDQNSLPLDKLYQELELRLSKLEPRRIKTLQLKLKFSDFRTTTAERSHHHLDKKLFSELAGIAWSRGNGLGIRLLGVGVSFEDDQIELNEQQMTLF
jgi:DNA polymerase-4